LTNNNKNNQTNSSQTNKEIICTIALLLCQNPQSQQRHSNVKPQVPSKTKQFFLFFSRIIALSSTSTDVCIVHMSSSPTAEPSKPNKASKTINQRNHNNKSNSAKEMQSIRADSCIFAFKVQEKQQTCNKTKK
jgi:hypothetical protein